MDRRAFIGLSLGALAAAVPAANAAGRLWRPARLDWSASEAFPGMPIRIDGPGLGTCPAGCRLEILSVPATAGAATVTLHNASVPSGSGELAWRIPAEPRALDGGSFSMAARILSADGIMLAETRHALRVSTRPFRFGL